MDRTDPHRHRVVAIVDDDEWVRRGRAEALREVVSRVVTGDHSQALQWTTEWDDVDAVLVDAHEQGDAWDRFGGVHVVERLRSVRPREEVRVVVVTGHAANDLLRLRFAEAGADYFFAHDEVRDLATLSRMLLDDLGEDRLALVAPRLNGMLREIEHSGAGDAFVPGLLQKQLPLSRRQVITLRRRLGRVLHGPGQPPPWRTIVETVNRARGHHGDRPS